MIQKIENLSACRELSSLQVSHNRLERAEDIEHLAECEKLSCVDLSHNRLDDEAIVDVFARMKSLRVLNLMGNPVVKKIKDYRKHMTVRIVDLQYLDDRPVFPKDRACAEAWFKGGKEAEKAERERWNQMDRDKIMDSVRALDAIRGVRQQQAVEQTKPAGQQNTAPVSGQGHDQEALNDIFDDDNKEEPANGDASDTSEQPDQTSPEVLEVKFPNSSSEGGGIFSQRQVQRSLDDGPPPLLECWTGDNDANDGDGDGDSRVPAVSPQPADSRRGTRLLIEDITPTIGSTGDRSLPSRDDVNLEDELD